MFQPAIRNGNRYCGPTSLSCVTGKPTKEIAAIIRHYFPRIKRVVGTPSTAITKVLQHYQVKASFRCLSGTFRSWIANWQRKDTTYILWVSNHYLVVRNNQVVCTQFRGQIGDINLSKYLRCRVSGHWVIESEPKEPIADIPKPDKVSRGVCFKRQTKKLCEKLDVEIDPCNNPRETTIWMYLSDEIIQKHFGGDDPWCDEHYFDSYEDCYNALKKIEKVVSGESTKVGV